MQKGGTPNGPIPEGRERTVAIPEKGAVTECVVALGAIVDRPSVSAQREHTSRSTNLGGERASRVNPMYKCIYIYIYVCICSKYKISEVSSQHLSAEIRTLFCHSANSWSIVSSRHRSFKEAGHARSYWRFCSNNCHVLALDMGVKESLSTQASEGPHVVGVAEGVRPADDRISSFA